MGNHGHVNTAAQRRPRKAARGRSAHLDVTRPAQHRSAVSTPDNPVGRHLATARKHRGWSQADLARAAGIKSRTTIQTLENGRAISVGYEGAVEVALGWELGTIGRIRRGERPAEEPDPIAISNEIRRKLGAEAAIRYLQGVIAERSAAAEEEAIGRARDALSPDADRT